MFSLLKRLEVTTLALIAGLGAALWTFLLLSDEIQESSVSRFDRTVMLAMRVPGHPSDPLGSPVFEEAVRDVTGLGSFVVLTLVTVVALIALLNFGQRRQALVFLIAVAFAQACSEILKAFFDRPRPDLVPHGVLVYSQSFPSGHSLLSAVVFLTLAAIVSSQQDRWRFKIFAFAVAIVLTGAIGLSRIYLGVHWPTDVLGGWTLGAAVALAARLSLGIWSRQKLVEGDSEI